MANVDIRRCQGLSGRPEHCPRKPLGKPYRSREAAPRNSRSSRASIKAIGVPWLQEQKPNSFGTITGIKGVLNNAFSHVGSHAYEHLAAPRPSMTMETKVDFLGREGS